MNRKLNMLAAICIGTCALCSDNRLLARDEMPDQAEMMARWQAFATPGTTELPHVFADSRVFAEREGREIVITVADLPGFLEATG